MQPASTSHILPHTFFNCSMIKPPAAIVDAVTHCLKQLGAAQLLTLMQRPCDGAGATPPVFSSWGGPATENEFWKQAEAAKALHKELVRKNRQRNVSSSREMLGSRCQHVASSTGEICSLYCLLFQCWPIHWQGSLIVSGSQDIHGF